ncbi:MAG: Agd3-related carbohydrate deacetylase [Solirubrobacteraceae bacterium]
MLRRIAPFTAVAALAVVVPVVLAATPTRVLPSQRIDIKVLLVSADGTEPGFGAWKAELQREGVPYSTFVAYSGQNRVSTLTDDALADYGANHAHYDAVILATGDLGHNVANANGTTSYLSALSDTEWASLAKFERTFGIRQLSDYTAPTPAHGLNVAGGATQDGNVGTLTALGKAAFPYLKGPVPFANDDPAVAETFGYAATPVNGQDWQTLLAGPNGTAYLGIYTHPDDGREEMVMTVASNENQSQAQLLRHGELNWVTRGVFLGYQRNYLELQVDDLFLGDDAWDPATHTTDYDPAKASRMTPADVAQAAAWSKARGVRIDFAFNGGGSELYKADHATTTDPLANAFADPATRGAFGYVNHTYDHPNIDCSTSSFIAKEIGDNVTWGRQHGLPLDPTEVVTGEHSGLANTRPGNPGTIDPPSFDDVTPAAGGTIPAGTYDYAITAQSPAGETSDSVVPGVAVAAGQRVTASFNAVCHATSYNLYRSSAGANSWTQVGTLARSATAATDDGTNPISLTITDTGAAGTSKAPPTANGAALAPYGQNPNLLAGLNGAGIKYVATDASKAYPTNPIDVNSPLMAIGAPFSEGAVQAFPRYPSNVYYNVSKQSQQLDEYNWIYVAPANGGGCVPIAGVTTCRTTPATWTDYVTSENNVMFRHVMGNDPRPHFMHQSNLADYNPALPETDPNQGGILYPVIDGLLGRYDAGIDRSSAPLLQLTSAQIAATLAQQSAWAANLAAGKVDAWLLDGVLHVRNLDGAAMDVPLTGTTVGDLYAGQRSGWTSIPAGGEQAFSPNDPANAAAPTVSGTAKAGSTLSASRGAWTGTEPIDHGYQWQRCTSEGCVNIPGATDASYRVAAADGSAKLRVVVSAGNWVSSVSQAASPLTASVPKVAGTKSQASKSSRLSLTKVKMSPRRFAVSHRHKRRGTRLDGSRITWKLSQAATVRLTIQRRGGSAKHRRWVRVGTLKVKAKKGNGVVRFRGRFGRKLLEPRGYRLVAMANTRNQKSPHKHVTFRVVKG